MVLKYDGLLEIATGRSRKELFWKNKELLWSAIVDQVKTTHRTAETYEDYLAAKRSRQDEIKDVGGYVGGYLVNGKRSATTVMHRQLLTLDLDQADADTWFDFELTYTCAAALYSTHKHSPAAPRYRLLIPLDKPVSPVEYIAIGRRMAGILGIEHFDNTTFEPSRFMYWPSTSADAEFVFEYQDGPWLNTADVLKTYRNFADSSEWPVSNRIIDAIQHTIKKQGDPLLKPGIIGAFCRTYTINEAIITFLTDEYEPADIEGRYTYKMGSTAAGLVIYDDKYAYSHHGTDPASGKLCNAFDLVRLHKFGLRDEDTKEGTPGNKLPSYTAMTEFVTKDGPTRKRIAQERIESAKDAFSHTDDLADASMKVTDTGLQITTNDDWLKELEVDKKGNIQSTINNIVLILNNDPDLKGVFALNEFEKREVALRNLPWRKIKKNKHYLTDTDDASLRHYLEVKYEFNASAKIEDGLAITVQANGFHPVKDYLKSLVWDGTERVDSLLIDYLGAEDHEYTRTVTRKVLCAAVGRIFYPGIKFDHMMIFVGEEGQGKSFLIDKLGKQWYSDSFYTMQGKEAYEQLQGVWLLEMAELSALKKTEIEIVKHFISKREDRYRVAFGHRTENFPRQCVPFGTSNNRNFLKGSDALRKFWPVDIKVTTAEKDIFTDLTSDEVDQIWAEATDMFLQGEDLFLSPEIEKIARQVQQGHTEIDARTELIQDYLEILLPEDWASKNIYQRREFLNSSSEISEVGTVRRDRVVIHEIWCECLGGQTKDITKYNTHDLHDIMKKMKGWQQHTSTMRSGVYGTQRGYVRILTGKQRQQ